MTQIKHILNFNPPANPTQDGLSFILKKVYQLKQWNGYLASSFPEEAKLFDYCQIVRIEGDTLVVLAENAHWATRFRLLQTKVLNALQQHPEFMQIRNIYCKVHPAQTYRY